ncbi:MAG: hypothetical protein MJA27_28550 [Pseudanabaenales cyanobacterium]|nr:hypothetical protein [Pseudanabaenales cyanobacterium]
MLQKSQSSGCIGQFFGGLLLLGGGAICFLFFAKLTELECKRLEPPTNQGQCQLVSHGVFSSDTTTISIKSLQGAKIQESRDSENDTTYRVVLLTAEGSFPFNKVYSSGRSGKQQKVGQIRSFVENTHQVNLKLKQDDRWLGYLFGVIFGGLGFLLVSSAILITPLKILTGRH